MRKTIIKTCSCFLDRAVWFMNTPKLKPYWFFDIAIPSSGINSDRFILERRTSNNFVNGEFVFKETIVRSCVDCFIFQVKLPIDPIISMLNDVKYRFVHRDMNVFDDNFNNEIFTGNCQFVVENYFYPREVFESQFENEKIDFIKQPLHKSCFVSLQVISFFVRRVKKLIMIFLKKSCMFYLELTINDFMTIKKKNICSGITSTRRLKLPNLGFVIVFLIRF